MPKEISYSTQYRSKRDFPMFKVVVGERARIVLIEPNPMMELLHYIKGQGSFVCLGDYDKVMGTGADSNCPFCRVAERSQDALVRPAGRRFVTHVLKYLTKRTGEPILPVTVEVQLWRFGEDKFSQLVSAAEMYEDLRKFDMVVECTDDTWARYNIQVIGNKPATYLSDKETAERIMAQYNTEKIKDLSSFLGRAVDVEEAQEIIDRITGQARRVELAQDDLGLLADLTSGQPFSKSDGVDNIPFSLDNLLDDQQ